MLECYGCTKRTVEPNCHSAERCEHWARHEEQERNKHEKEAELRLMNNNPRVKWRKGAGSKAKSQYVIGEVRPYTKRGCTAVKEGSKREPG